MPDRIGNTVPIWAHDPRALAVAVNRQIAVEQQKRRVYQARHDVRQALGLLMGPQYPRRNLHDSILEPRPEFTPPGLLGPSLGFISRQQTHKDIRNLFRYDRGGQSRILERLRAVGLVDSRGTTTDRERQQVRQAQRQALVDQAWRIQQYQNTHGTHEGIGYREFMDRVRAIPTDELRRRVAAASRPQNIQRMGFDPSSLGGLIEGTASGLGDLASTVTDNVIGNNVVGNAAHDVLMWPTWAVPAAYEAVTHPGRFAQGLTQGAIGHLVTGDLAGAERVFKQHPLFSLAEIRGAGALGGRLAAAPIRQLSGGRFLGTGRAPLNLTGLEGTRAVQERFGTKQLLFPRVRQQLADLAFTKPAPAVELEGRGLTAARQYRTDLPVIGKLLDEQRRHQIRRHQDYSSSRANTSERVAREEAATAARNAQLKDNGLGWVMRVLGVPGRPSTAAGYHGVLGKIAARTVDGLTNPVADLVSFAARGVIRSEIRDEHGNLVGPATHKSVAEDIDRLIVEIQQRLDPRNEGAIRSKPELVAAHDMLEFLHEVRHSRQALDEVHRITRRLTPEFARSDRELTRLGALDRQAAERAPLFPGAMSILGAKYGPTKASSFAHDEQIATLKAARAQAKEARNRAQTVKDQQTADAVLRAVNNDLRKAYKARQQMGLRTAGGEALSNDQIRAGLAATGIDPSSIFHLPHQDLGSGAWHKLNALQRRSADSQRLTGANWLKGQSPYTYQHVIDSLVHSRTLATNIQALDQAIHDIGTRITGIHDDHGRPLPDGSWQATQKWAERQGKVRVKVGDKTVYQPKYVVVRSKSSQLAEDRRALIGDLQSPITLDEAINDTHLADRTTPPAKDAKDVAVAVPYEWFARATANLKSGSSIAEFQALSSAFRQTVLPFSAKWLFGNVAEAILRTAAVTVNPFDRRVARYVLDRMIAEDALALYGRDPHVRAIANALLNTKQRGRHPLQTRRMRVQLYEYAPRARAAESELTGGLLYGSRGLSVRRTASEMGPVGQAVAAVGRLPFINEFVGLTRWVAGKSFAFNRVFEREAEYLTLGKHARNEVQAWHGKWISGARLYERGLEEYSRGLLGTSTQVKAAKFLDETLGQYSRFSPKLRKIIQTYTPFLPWYLNAVRWTLWTLPVKHPIKTALLISAERTFEQDWNAQHNDKLTRHGELATYPVGKDGGLIPLTHYTPFGLTGPLMGGQDPRAIPGLVLPQFSGALNALSGLDAFGNPLVIPKKYGGTGENLQGGALWGLAANQLLESLIPGLQIARRLQEHGETALPTSTAWAPKTKPGSSHGQSALERVFVPWREIYLRSTAAGGSGRAAVDPVDEIVRGLSSVGPDGVNQDAVDEIVNALGG